MFFSKWRICKGDKLLLRHLLHDLTTKHFAVGVFVALDAVAAPGVPLLEERGCSVSFGLLLDVERLFFFHWAGLGAAPASDEARQECLFKLYKKMTAKK